MIIAASVGGADAVNAALKEAAGDVTFNEIPLAVVQSVQTDFRQRATAHTNASQAPAGPVDEPPPQPEPAQPEPPQPEPPQPEPEPEPNDNLPDF